MIKLNQSNWTLTINLGKAIEVGIWTIFILGMLESLFLVTLVLAFIVDFGGTATMVRGWYEAMSS